MSMWPGRTKMKKNLFNNNLALDAIRFLPFMKRQWGMDLSKRNSREKVRILTAKLLL